MYISCEMLESWQQSQWILDLVSHGPLLLQRYKAEYVLAKLEFVLMESDAAIIKYVRTVHFLKKTAL